MRGEFRAIEQTDGRAAPQYTTAEMIRMEKEIVARCREAMIVAMAIRCWFHRSCEFGQKTGTLS